MEVKIRYEKGGSFAQDFQQVSIDISGTPEAVEFVKELIRECLKKQEHWKEW